MTFCVLFADLRITCVVSLFIILLDTIIELQHINGQHASYDPDAGQKQQF